MWVQRIDRPGNGDIAGAGLLSVVVDGGVCASRGGGPDAVYELDSGKDARANGYRRGLIAAGKKRLPSTGGWTH